MRDPLSLFTKGLARSLEDPRSLAEGYRKVPEAGKDSLQKDLRFPDQEVASLDDFDGQKTWSGVDERSKKDVFEDCLPMICPARRLHPGWFGLVEPSKFLR